MRSSKTDDGYRIEVTIPLVALRPRDAKTGVIGFDIMIDDTDTGQGRDTQMVWAGTAINHLKPSFYGAVRIDAGPRTKPV